MSGECTISRDCQGRARITLRHDSGETIEIMSDQELLCAVAVARSTIASLHAFMSLAEAVLEDKL